MPAQALGAATGSAKLDAVSKLVGKLTKDMGSLSMAPKDRNHALEELKIYGRDPRNADPIFTKEGISMLLAYAFNDKAPSETSRGALRVLANSMVLKPETRQMFVNSGYATKACKRLDTDSWDDEFLLSRILFLSTYSDDKIKLSPLIKEHGLATSINANIGRHAKLKTASSLAAAGPMEEMALPETLKLLYNVTYFCPEEASAFEPSVPQIISILCDRKLPSSKVLNPPFGPLVNSLLYLDLAVKTSHSALFPSGEETKLGSKLIEILDRAMKEYSSQDLDATVTPVVKFLLEVYNLGSESVQKKLRDGLLPTSEDRQNVLGKGSSLSARLLKTSTDPLAPNLGPVISHLFFLMSNNDASKFVENVGYGYASGYLFRNNVPMPASAKATFDATDEGGSQRPVNPITGQFIDREERDDLPPMTEEEKEREAERLFVLFERLKKNGVLSVQNPVEQAAREGKLRELRDDEVEELD
ncbi:Synembryn-like protein C3E7.04c [Beauveria bassiana]|nr:Synembryn-like protein C3E7.04c [Beauveria bassiana]